MAKLTLEVAGEDLTKAEARLTQAAIEEHLAVNLLARVAFHSQTDITALLEVRHHFSLASYVMPGRIPTHLVNGLSESL